MRIFRGIESVSWPQCLSSHEVFIVEKQREKEQEKEREREGGREREREKEGEANRMLAN